ncbi:hypothetical protein PLICRDRAFT_653411 [Plicaturopsis crispa FD-325 SS-3]|nr:hypothetical protein PLICRDRAFT_653411 [Plicaturopsis crispa FD-325 SS-3]
MKLLEMANYLLYELFTRVVRDMSREFVPNDKPPLMGRVAFTKINIGQPPDSVVLALVKSFEERTWPAAVQRINAREQEHAAEIAAATRAADERTRAAEERTRAAEQEAKAAREQVAQQARAMAEMEAQMEARIAAELARREAARVA